MATTSKKTATKTTTKTVAKPTTATKTTTVAAKPVTTTSKIPAYNAATGATTGKPSKEYDNYLKSLNKPGHANYVVTGDETPNDMARIEAGKIGTKAIDIPQPPTQPDYMGTLLGANKSLVNPALGVTEAKGTLSVTPPAPVEGGQQSGDLTSIFKQYAGLQEKAPSAEKMYNSMPEKADLERAQADVQNYSGQINAITSKAQADILSTQGQGRGIPEAIIGGQQAQLSKEAAIAALPLQALLANAQGNVELAQTHLDTLFKLKMQDAQSAYEYKNKMLDAAMQVATKQEQRQYDAIQKADDRKYNDLQAQQSKLQDLAFTLTKNGASAATIGSVVKSNNFMDALNIKGVSSYLTSPADKLDMQIKRAQLSNISTKGDSLLSIDESQKLGVPYGTTRAQAIALQGKGTASEAQLKTFNAAQDLLVKLQNGKTGVGGNIPVGGGNIGFKIPGSKRADFVAQANNLTALLTLDNLKYLKGPTSDKDIVFLTSASTALNRNQSVPEYTKTLTNIRDTLAKYSPDYLYSQAAAELAGQSTDNPISSYTSSLLK